MADEEDVPEQEEAAAASGASANLLADDDFDFEGGDAGTSATEPRQCSALRKNGFVIMKGRPCKIVEMTVSKTGKHGHAKVHLVGLDIFTGKKYDDACPSTHNMDVPHVRRREFELLNVSNEGFLEMMSEGIMKEDVRVPEGDLGEEIRRRFENNESLIITVISACGEEAAISVRNATADRH